MNSEKLKNEGTFILEVLLYIAGANRYSVSPQRLKHLSSKEVRAVDLYIKKDSVYGPTLNQSGAAMRKALIERIGPVTEEGPVDRTEIPQPKTISNRLKLIGSHSNIMRLKTRLLEEGWSMQHAELGMQRAIDSGAIIQGRDYSLSLPT